MSDEDALRAIASDGRAHLSPPSPESTERTERSGANPGGERARGVRSDTERSPNGDRTERPELAQETDILAVHDDLMGELGLVAERHISRGTYLVHISRLLHDPARQVVKGDSSTGKSFAVECGLSAAAPEELYVRTSASPKALFYSERDFRHTTIVFYEANNIGDEDDELAKVLRTLISENRLAYEITVVEKRTSVLMEKEGPVAFITTTCKATLDREIETRILSMHSDNSDEQTTRVVKQYLEGAAGVASDPDVHEWEQLDRWLANGKPYDVALPWGPALAAFELTGPPRLRRDIKNLVALARANAVLHQHHRDRDEHGRIVSTLEDYEVVRNLLSDAMAVATDKAVRKGTRKIVDAVEALKAENVVRVSMSAASRKAGRSKSTTNTDVHDAIDRGYLVNLSHTPDRFDLDIGDPLPDQADLLPKTEDLEQAFARRSPTVRSTTERFKPALGAGLRQSVRSVRSNPEVEGQLAEFERKLEEKRRGSR